MSNGERDAPVNAEKMLMIIYCNINFSICIAFFEISLGKKEKFHRRKPTKCRKFGI